MNKQKTYIITAPVDYVVGYLRYGHKELVLTCSEQELEQYLQNPEELMQNAELIVDDYRIEDYGDIDYNSLEVSEISM